MATVIQNTIGTGGDYTSVQAWDDAAPTDLVAADQIWEGLLAAEVFSKGAVTTIGGSTTDANCYKHLTTQVGASFADNPAHALMYDTANGATLRNTDDYSRTLVISEPFSRISRLQVYGGNACVECSAGDNVISDCIIYTNKRTGIISNSSNNKIWNTCVFHESSSGFPIVSGSNSTYYGCTVVRVTTTSHSAVDPGYSKSFFKNCVFANFSKVADSNPSNVECTNCFTTTGAPHAGCIEVPYDTTTGTGFISIANGLSGDYKLNPTSSLVDAGAVYAPYTDFDIYGTPRGATPDVGSYEIGGPPVGVDHAADGDVEGNTADVTGEAVLTEPAPHHQATGAVTGLTSTVTGAAKRFLLHTTSGDVVDSNDAAVTGQAELINAVYLHETEGVLTGQFGTVTGTARRFRTHPTDGIVIGDPWATVEGLAEIVSPPGEHETYGALSGQHGTVVGTAKHLRKHTTNGALVGRTAVVTGDASKFAEHDSSGIIVGYDAKVVGSATNVGSLTLTPADIAAIVAAIKAEIIPVDIVRVNHIDVDGTGADSDPWGPV